MFYVLKIFNNFMMRPYTIISEHNDISDGFTALLNTFVKYLERRAYPSCDFVLIELNNVPKRKFMDEINKRPCYKMVFNSIYKSCQLYFYNRADASTADLYAFYQHLCILNAILPLDKNMLIRKYKKSGGIYFYMSKNELLKKLFARLINLEGKTF